MKTKEILIILKRLREALTYNKEYDLENIGIASLRGICAILNILELSQDKIAQMTALLFESLPENTQTYIINYSSNIGSAYWFDNKIRVAIAEEFEDYDAAFVVKWYNDRIDLVNKTIERIQNDTN